MNMTEIKDKKDKKRGVGDVALWHSTCLVCTRPFVQFQNCLKKEKEKKNKEKKPTNEKLVERYEDIVTRWLGLTYYSWKDDLEDLVIKSKQNDVKKQLKTWLVGWHQVF